MTIIKSGNGYIVSDVLNINGKSGRHSKYYAGYTENNAKAKFILDYHLTHNASTPNDKRVTE